jgi:hypothetical protein
LRNQYSLSLFGVHQASSVWTQSVHYHSTTEFAVDLLLQGLSKDPLEHWRPRTTLWWIPHKEINQLRTDTCALSW